jgi:hypothetical protein
MENELEIIPIIVDKKISKDLMFSIKLINTYLKGKEKVL